MHITFCADSNFLKLLELAVFSVLKSQSKPMSLHILKLDDFSTENLAKLAKNYNCDILFYDFSTDLYELGRFSKAMYGRLYLADILPIDVETVLYLDCDIIVKGDLSPVFDNLSSNLSLFAVPEAPSLIKSYLLRKLSLTDYFNSGVLLFNLSVLRKNKKLSATLNYIRNNPSLLYPDQDALNVVFQGDWQILSTEFNYMALDYNENATIIHYATAKPWNGNENKNAFIYYELQSNYPYLLPHFPSEKKSKSKFAFLMKILFMGKAMKWFYWRLIKPLRDKI